MMNANTDSKASNSRVWVEGKHRGSHQWRELPHVLWLCSHLDASDSDTARERIRWDSSGPAACLWRGAEPACTLYDAYGTLHFSEAKFLPKLLRVWLLVCEVSFTILLLINRYWAFSLCCLCSPLTICISPTLQSKSSSPASLSFHLPFLFHNVTSLRLHILTGNVSLQTERVSIACLMFHQKMALNNTFFPAC